MTWDMPAPYQSQGVHMTILAANEILHTGSCNRHVIVLRIKYVSKLCLITVNVDRKQVPFCINMDKGLRSAIMGDNHQ
jgi:hypothetical protein